MLDIFNPEKIIENAPNSKCDILLCDNPHNGKLEVNLDGKSGEVFICDDCRDRHITEYLTYFFFVDKKGLDIKIIYFRSDEEELHGDIMWEEVSRYFFEDLFRYQKECEGGLF